MSTNHKQGFGNGGERFREVGFHSLSFGALVESEGEVISSEFQFSQEISGIVYLSIHIQLGSAKSKSVETGEFFKPDQPGCRKAGRIFDW